MGGPYNKFQLLAYEVSTAGWSAAGGLPAWDAGRYRPPSGALVPVPDLGQRDDEDLDEYSDAINRISRFASVVEHTHIAGGGEKRWGTPGVLKVFVAPEFYFRPQHGVGGRAAYSARLARRIFTELARLFRHEVFEDWIFVCGTVVYWDTSVTGDVYHNAAVLVRGGPQGGYELLEKHEASEQDGVPVANTPGNTPSLKSRHIGFGELQRHLSTAKGVELGLEICLEHAIGVLRSVLISKSDHLRTVLPGVQLHILTAGGMPVQPACLGARARGYLLRVDGVSGPPSQLLRVDRWQAAGQPGQNTPSYVDAEPVVTEIPADPRLAVPIPAELCLPTPPGPWQVAVHTQQISVYQFGEIASAHR